jgi:hypothetical protein
VLPGVLDHHELVLALLDLHLVVFDLGIEALLLAFEQFYLLGELVGLLGQDLALLFQGRDLAGGLLQLLLQEQDLVVHALQDHQLFDLFKVKAQGYSSFLAACGLSSVPFLAGTQGRERVPAREKAHLHPGRGEYRGQGPGQEPGHFLFQGEMPTSTTHSPVAG